MPSSSGIGSLLMAFLALSPSAVGLEEDTNEIIQEAHKAAVAPKQPKKPYARHVKAPTARRMRWRRFRYEMSLKTKALGGKKSKDKEKEKWIAMDEMEGKKGKK